MEKIGTIIHNHRIARGLTQEELGNKVFVSKQAVSKWETGKTLPDIEMIRKLCEVLEINKDEILGGSIKETKKSRKLIKICAAISVISILLALFFAVDGFDYIDRHTQSGVTYVSVFSDGELLTADEYRITSDPNCDDFELNFEDFKNGYKADTDYGQIRGTIHIPKVCEIEFGFINANNWHNVHIRVDIEKENNELKVTQTISYETDNHVYDVIVTENTTTGKEVSVFRRGV